MKKVIYLGYYSTPKDERNVSPAGATMMEYVAEAINRSGHHLTIISPAQTSDGTGKSLEISRFDKNTPLVYLTSFKRYSRKNLLMRFLQKIKRERRHLKELCGLIEDGDTVVAYHSLALIKILKKLRKKKKIKFVLQVCEIYADVLENKKIRKKETDFISCADAYIFSSNLLEQELNKRNKDFAICLGKYSIEPRREVNFNDGKIHIVYAGTLDPRKGGGLAAIESAVFLPETCRMHILGFGSDKEIEDINSKIEEVNALGKCEVTYEGCLNGESFTEFLQKCQIGLSTQNPDAAFNATSFPSKILVYLANGLQVVSIKIPAIETSSVAEVISFYDVQTPEEIANAIKNAKNSTKSNDFMKNLDEKFKKEIIKLLEK